MANRAAKSLCSGIDIDLNRRCGGDVDLTRHKALNADHQRAAKDSGAQGEHAKKLIHAAPG